MATRKRRSPNPEGRPSEGLTEASTLVRGPAELLERMKAHAHANGQAVSYVWRKAAEEFLARAK